MEEEERAYFHARNNNSHLLLPLDHWQVRLSPKLRRIFAELLKSRVEVYDGATKYFAVKGLDQFSTAQGKSPKYCYMAFTKQHCFLVFTGTRGLYLIFEQEGDATRVKNTLPYPPPLFTASVGLASQDTAPRETSIQFVPPGSAPHKGVPLILTREDDPSFPVIVGSSRALREAAQLIQRVAQNDSTLLITGESGTGKELFARALHNLSHRRNEPFVTINCGAIPDTLIEAELFGYEAGAFTDAKHAKAGQFELAHTGTLFLDEIGDLSLQTQVKLLRALQERRVRRVGGTKEVVVDVRVVSATNQNLIEAIASKRFREDLYFRLDVISVAIPPLRERKEDIIPLIKWFWKKKTGQAIKLPPETAQLLTSYRWPGNVRELGNSVERAVALCVPGDKLLPSHFIAAWGNQNHSGQPTTPPSFIPPGLRSYTDEQLASLFHTIRRSVEEAFMQEALRRTKDNKNKAALLLGVARATFYRKKKAYEISVMH